MNGKPDEPLDHWLRQSLSRLPDAPPPNTAFDANRLWEQLRPELQKTRANRPLGSMWWTAAACVTVALLGWFAMDQLLPSRSHPTSRTEHPTMPAAIHTAPQITAGIDRAEAVHPVKTRSSSPSYTHRLKHSVKSPPSVLPEKEPAQPVAPVTEMLSLRDTTSALPTPPESAKIRAVMVPKRRFQVVHLNELQAEEAIRPTPSRTDRFVRLGAGNQEQSAPETAHPTIIWPIN